MVIREKTNIFGHELYKIVQRLALLVSETKRKNKIANVFSNLRGSLCKSGPADLARLKNKFRYFLG